MNKLKVALIFGGSSGERGISLNSARSVLDHLQAPDVEIYPIYFDMAMQPYSIPVTQLYSNTPSDFDFKLETIGTLLDSANLVNYLKSVDIVFSAVHGAYGEGGQLQDFLESIDVPFIGSGAATCRQAFDKYKARVYLKENGFYTLPSLLIKKETFQVQKPQIAQFFERYNLDEVAVKPAQSGSSLGVGLMSGVDDVVSWINTEIFANALDDQAIIEPSCKGKGKEFTLIILQNGKGEPVALIPTEIELRDSDIFGYREKYLTTTQRAYHSPPRFSDEVISKVRSTGERIFDLFKMRDFARLDGWVLNDGNIWFSDFNIVSGMEQNSFLFLQGSQIGMSHADLLRYLLKHACQRYNISLSETIPSYSSQDKMPVNVIFGGNSSERHVSLMSGSNVWLKLRRSEIYEPHPFLLDVNLDVWRLTYSLTLRHTVEEVVNGCKEALLSEERLSVLRKIIVDKLAPNSALLTQNLFIPEKMSLDEFIASSDVVFIALHGGMGENGELQNLLEGTGTFFTGSGSATSRLCADKYDTAQALTELSEKEIFTAKKVVISPEELQSTDLKDFWSRLQSYFSSDSIIVKPSADGCSSGIVRLYNESNLQLYLNFLEKGSERIPKHTFPEQDGIIEMPTSKPETLLFEEFIETDDIIIDGNTLKWQSRTHWIEITVGVLGSRKNIRALTPSMTVANGNILSLEEKFQGGTGVNITPPPVEFVSPHIINMAKERIENVARALGISGFARIDAFLNIENGHLIIIEANTIPGLTPSTVIFHQALAEQKPLDPTMFVEEILNSTFEQ